jgi:ferredoxin
MTTASKARPAFDRQGEQGDDERLDAALRSFVGDIGPTVALHLESCVRCGLCAQACHFHLATGDPKYTPAYKLEPTCARPAPSRRWCAGSAW